MSLANSAPRRNEIPPRKTSYIARAALGDETSVLTEDMFCVAASAHKESNPLRFLTSAQNRPRELARWRDAQSEDLNKRDD